MYKINKKELKEMKYQKTRKCELLYNGVYKGYQFYVLNLGTHPTAYIEIPKNSKFYKVDYDDIEINVYGGLTYSADNLYLSNDYVLDKSWFIGWDYAHFGDYYGAIDYDLKYDTSIGGYLFNKYQIKKWTTEEIINDCVNVIEQIERKDK